MKRKKKGGKNEKEERLKRRIHRKRESMAY
jgi:hypothetical protein